MKKLFVLAFLWMSGSAVMAQPLNNPGSNHANRFEELGYLLPTPNEYRTASGAPGPKYWQQKADYDINCTLDEKNLRLTGSEIITYTNNSPDLLTYLWIQLDENIHHPASDNLRDNQSRMRPVMNHRDLSNLENWKRAEADGLGLNITLVADATGKQPLKYTINKTMMRIDLPNPLKPGQKFAFRIDWNYKIPDRMTWGSRGGYEFFEDGNAVFTMSQFYPRMAVYNDFKGWQNQQFNGGAEFALTFGDFKVKMTVPSDFIVAATGECQNYKQVLSPEQYSRWMQAVNASEPIEVVTLDEATQNEKDVSTDTKTWIYHANNVRDFAWGASRKFIWDAMATNISGKKVMAMSYYPKEAYTLYRKYSTKVVAHTLKVYSKYTIDYPYPVAISVEASQGMEYPMIAFNYGRTEKDGTYSEATKYGMISVIIHEVGHNFFPMIVNSDERQYWWMDEGLNTFVQFLTEQEFDNNYPSSRGPAHRITGYMSLPKDQLEPIMTKGDAVLQVGPNAYSKAATGLNILRETIMGRELFDFAFKQYATRWAFKHPTPADLFRTMEDASAVDLDWFWRGWYFGTDPVDIALDSVKYFRLDNPEEKSTPDQFETISKRRNKADKSLKYAVDEDKSLRDFYFDNPGADRAMFEENGRANYARNFDKENASQWANKHFYELTFTNKGGLVMPIIVEFTFEDGSKQVVTVPVNIWKLNENQVKKVFVLDKKVKSIQLDPDRETADINEENGMWPVREMPSKFQLFKQGNTAARGQSTGNNAMQKANQKKN